MNNFHHLHEEDQSHATHHESALIYANAKMTWL